MGLPPLDWTREQFGPAAAAARSQPTEDTIRRGGAGCSGDVSPRDAARAHHGDGDAA